MISGIILNVCRLKNELIIYPPTINARTVCAEFGTVGEKAQHQCFDDAVGAYAWRMKSWA